MVQKREHARHPIDDMAVACSFLTTEGIGATYNGKIVNFSENGICAELDGDLKKGSILLVKTNRSPLQIPTRNKDEHIPFMRIAIVRWSNDISFVNARYVAGLQYVMGENG